MAKPGEVQCGDEAKDLITGYTGIAVAVTVWLNGCERITIQSRSLNERGQAPISETFDCQQIEIINEKVIPAEYSPRNTRDKQQKSKEKSPGGDRPNIKRNIDPI